MKKRRNSLPYIRLITACGLSVAMSIFSYAQTPDASTADHSERQAIEEHITTGGVIVIQMPSALKDRLRQQTTPQESTPTVVSGRMAGYRIQVFADNNPRTAKNEARARARNIVNRFSDYPSYVEYKSPYWRTRIGNFRTHDEAEKAAAALKEAFPSYSREIRVVRDRIIIGE